MLLEVRESFIDLCAGYGRRGVFAATPLTSVRWIPEQEEYIRGKIASLDAPPENITAVSIGIGYTVEEIEGIPTQWVERREFSDKWEAYAEAYGRLNRMLNEISQRLAQRFGGVSEEATFEGFVAKIKHVKEYFPVCASHRSVAESAGLGWRGRHGLLVTPEFGPALRLATVFLPVSWEAVIDKPVLAGCGDCVSCLEACPILKKYADLEDANVYREMCRRHLARLSLKDEVCGICTKRCWEFLSSLGSRQSGLSL